jgi:hypothetical protein
MIACNAEHCFQNKRKQILKYVKIFIAFVCVGENVVYHISK